MVGTPPWRRIRRATVTDVNFDAFLRVSMLCDPKIAF
jgi:hypothetical protein